MSKFKVGDKVRVISDKGSEQYIGTIGKVFTVTKVLPDFGIYEGMDLIYTDHTSDHGMYHTRFELVDETNEGREAVKKAIDVFRKYNIRRHKVGLCNNEQFFSDEGGLAKTEAELLDHLFPPKDPHKEEREAIEKEMRALADRLAEIDA